MNSDFTCNRLCRLTIACLFFLIAITGAALAQVYNGQPQPTALLCAYNTSPPTPVAGKFFYVQCDSQGRIIVQ